LKKYLITDHAGLSFHFLTLLLINFFLFFFLEMYETYSTEVMYNSADFRHAIQTWTFSTKTYCLENFV